MHSERSKSDEFMIKPILETRIIELTNGNENFAKKVVFGAFDDKICQNCAISCYFYIVFELKPPFAFTESISFQDKVIEESFSFPKWAYSYIHHL